jgi:hypothetical protein
MRVQAMLAKARKWSALQHVAAVESAACEPGHGAFDCPAVTAEALGRLDALAGDAMGDPG